MATTARANVALMLWDTADRHGGRPAILHAGSTTDYGALAVRAGVDGRAVEDRYLSITVEDTGAGASGAALAHGRESGVGLKNVERRLQCHYGDAGSLSIQSVPNVGTTVQIRLPVPTRVTEVHDPAQVAL